MCEKVIGIDLGTTNSVVSVWDAKKKKVYVICDREHDSAIPSVVMYMQEGRIVGKDAQKML